MKKNLRSKILLCVLAGGVLAANTAFAAEEENTIGTVIVDDTQQTIDVSKDYSIGSNDAENVQITSDSGNSGFALKIIFPAKGTINGQQLTVNGQTFYAGSGVELAIGTKGVTNTVSINSSNQYVVYSVNSAQVNISAENININSYANFAAPAVWAQGGGSINLNGENINLKSKEYGLVAFSGGKLNVNANLTVNADRAIGTRGDSTIDINTDGKHTTVLNGDIVFETPNEPNDDHNSGSIINSKININLSGEESSWTGRAYQEYKVDNGSGVYEYTHSVELDAPDRYGDVTGFEMNINNGASWNMTGDSFINNITVENGGVVNVQEVVKEFNVGTAADAGGITLNNGIVNLQGENQQITVTELDGAGGTVNTNSLNNKMRIGTVADATAITVNGSGEIADAIYGGDATAQDLADVVTTGTGDYEKSAAS